MEIKRVENLGFKKLMHVLTSSEITEKQKTQFIQKNKPQVENIMKIKISSMDYKTLMQKRTLKKFRPIKNSFTKKGDKLILAKALHINPSEVNDYIKKTAEIINNINDIDFLSQDKIEMIKTYVYRHGSKDELVNLLDYELTKTKDITKSLYTTLEYYSGGVADYFIRPIHRMDNKTMIKIFNIINKNIKQKMADGNISEAESEKLAKWALIKIYRIQNNSKLINAIKTYNIIK